MNPINRRGALSFLRFMLPDRNPRGGDAVAAKRSERDSVIAERGAGESGSPPPTVSQGPRQPRRPCVHDSRRLDGWLDSCCMRCGKGGYWRKGKRLESSGQFEEKVHPSGKMLIREIETPGSEEEGDAEKLIRAAHGSRRRVCICAETAQVVRDDRKPTPYEIDGCAVGAVVSLNADYIELGGFSFVTRIKWSDVRGAWLRSAAPDPCPHCSEPNPPAPKCDPDHPCEPNDHICRRHGPPAPKCDGSGLQSDKRGATSAAGCPGCSACAPDTLQVEQGEDRIMYVWRLPDGPRHRLDDLVPPTDTPSQPEAVPAPELSDEDGKRLRDIADVLEDHGYDDRAAFLRNLADKSPQPEEGESNE